MLLYRRNNSQTHEILDAKRSLMQREARIEGLCVGGFPSDHKIHGCEELLLATSNKAVCCKSKTVGSLLGTLGRETDHLKTTDELVDEATSDLGHAKDGGNVANGADVLQLTGQRPVPWVRVVPVCQILVVLHDEASLLHGIERNLNLLHVRDTVTNLDSETDLAVVGVVVVVLVGHEPFVDTKDTAGLENAEDLAVDTLERWCVDSGLDGVDSIERVVGERHLLRAVSERYSGCEGIIIP